MSPSTHQLNMYGLPVSDYWPTTITCSCSFKHNTSFVSRLSTIRRHKPVAQSVSQLSAPQLANTPTPSVQLARASGGNPTSTAPAASESPAPMASIHEQTSGSRDASPNPNQPEGAARRGSVKSTVSVASLTVITSGNGGAGETSLTGGSGEQVVEVAQQQQQQPAPQSRQPVRAILRNRLMPSDGASESPPGGAQSGADLPTFTCIAPAQPPPHPPPSQPQPAQQQQRSFNVARSVGYESSAKRNSDGKFAADRKWRACLA